MQIFKKETFMFNNNCNNRCCFDPFECQPEPCCCIGATGPTGSTGPTGPAGGFQAAYGTFIGTQTSVIQPNTLAPLDTVLSVPPVGIMFTPGSTTVTVLNAGIYRVTYQLISNSQAYYALVINGAVLPNSTFSSLSNISNTGTATVALAAGSTLGIISLDGNTQSEIPNAVLDVLRIS